jgi:GT2 family glycosyltransferase
MIEHNMTRPLVSVVIVTHNTSQTLQHCLKSIARSTYTNIEVILVDNASKNNIYALLIKEFPSVNITYIRNSQNVGHAEGFNKGFRVATGEYIMKVDDDVEVDKFCIEALVTYLQNNPYVAIVQPLILHKENDRYLPVGSLQLDILGFEHPIVDTSIRKAFYAAGAAFMIRRKALEQASLGTCFFDPDYFIYYDDVDACWRLRLATGLDIHVIYSAKAYHTPVKKATQRTHARYVYFHTRNKLMTLIKNYRINDLIKYMPILTLLDIGRVFIYLLINPEAGFAIIRGYIWNLLNLKKILKKKSYCLVLLKKGI